LQDFPGVVERNGIGTFNSFTSLPHIEPKWMYISTTREARKENTFFFAFQKIRYRLISYIMPYFKNTAYEHVTLWKLFVIK
jgi:hypothetical protein